MCCEGRLVTGEIIDETLELVAFKTPLSIYGELEEGCFAGKAVYAPATRGSTVAPFVLYKLARRGKAPRAIIVSSRAEPMLVAACVLAGVTLIDMLDCKLEGGLVNIRLLGDKRVLVCRVRGKLEKELEG